MIHELMHFTVVAGTHDHAYGQTDARALAVSNPVDAVDNSDNHEYFVENTPVIADAAPAVVVDTTEHAFGEQAVGGTATARTVSMTNTGDAPMTVGAIAPSGAFGITGDACSSRVLAAGATCTFALTFAPVAAGAQAAAIDVPTDARIAAQSIAVTGTGLEPAPAATPVAQVPAAVARATPRLAVRVTGRRVRVTVSACPEVTGFLVQVRRKRAWVGVGGVRPTRRPVTLAPGVYRAITAETAACAAGATRTFTIARGR